MTTLSSLQQGSIFRLTELPDSDYTYQGVSEPMPERRKVSLEYTYVRLSETMRVNYGALDVYCTELETGAVKTVRDNLAVRVITCIQTNED